MAMHIDTSSIAYFAIGACVAGILWAVFWPGQRRRDKTRPSNHWELIYVDEDGVLLFTLIRVLHIDTEARRLTAWCSRSACQRVFKFSKIVKAVDVQTGARVHLVQDRRREDAGTGRRQAARQEAAPLATPQRRRSDHASHRDMVWCRGWLAMLVWGHGQAHNR
jgi:hypothetical protein